jgi:Fur family zinc uptake transcriptional regulator
MDKSTKELLAQAEKLCVQRNVRLTPQRLEVLRLMSLQQGAISAYDLLDLLRESEPQAKPPTVYRALDFLLENGLVHRIASLNAFVGCSHPEHAHQGQFLICRECHAAIELEQKSISDAIIKSSADVGFKVEGQTVEVVGLCSGCQGA